MSDFSDRPFAVGTLTGLRAFTVDDLGRLRAPQQNTIWRPGENVAECRAREIDKAAMWSRQVYRQITSSGMWTTGVTLRPALNSDDEKPEAEKRHRAGAINCGCGFYAYTDGTNTYHESDDRTVQAVVEGYGLATVGARGFRSEKARLLAFVVPEREAELNVKRLTKKERWRVLVMSLLVAINALGASRLLEHKNVGQIILASFSALALLLCILTIVETVRKARLREPKPAPVDLAATLLLYPEVETYPTLKAALAAHPLSVQPKPSPETRDDFWTNTGISA